jgi:sec-independent protein translocase protein TatA
VIALIILGPKGLPSAGRSLGQGIREFKGSLTGAATKPDEPAEPS